MGMVCQMMRRLAPPLVATLLASASGALGQELIAVPSGQPVWLQEAFRDKAAEAMRYRFIAPDISRDAGKVTFDEVEADLLDLCESFVLARPEMENPPDLVILSLADREVEFGQANPDATQFIEAYRPQNGICLWEGF